MLSSVALAQQEDQLLKWTTLALYKYRVVPNIAYQTAGGVDIKLDVTQAKEGATPRPTVIFIHGGGWSAANKDREWPWALPYLVKGMSFVNVDYRHSPVALAPAAVEDCRCALRWVYNHAKEYNFDLTRLIVVGYSAGGHLALTTGMLTSAAGFDDECAGEGEMKVAAIVNLYGVTDVVDSLERPNTQGQSSALRWFGSVPNRKELARRLSPINLVRSGLPPVLTIHGDLDPAVPYEQAVRLHEALDRVGARNQLLTFAGGGHGFNLEQALEAQETIFAFLIKYGVLTR
jgi:acetyl esterase/lipase